MHLHVKKHPDATPAPNWKAGDIVIVSGVISAGTIAAFHAFQLSKYGW